MVHHAHLYLTLHGAHHNVVLRDALNAVLAVVNPAAKSCTPVYKKQHVLDRVLCIALHCMYQCDAGLESAGNARSIHDQALE